MKGGDGMVLRSVDVYMSIFCRWKAFCTFFFFNDTATTEIYTLSLHDALPICHFIVEREKIS